MRRALFAFAAGAALGCCAGWVACGEAIGRAMTRIDAEYRHRLDDEEGHANVYRGFRR